MYLKGQDLWPYGFLEIPAPTLAQSLCRARLLRRASGRLVQVPYYDNLGPLSQILINLIARQHEISRERISKGSVERCVFLNIEVAEKGGRR